MSSPNVIEESHIQRLNDVQLHRLLRRLLLLETGSIGLTPLTTSVSLNIKAKDGGEDGSISWSGGPDPAGYIPKRNNLFQCKATYLDISGCKNELIDSSGNIKRRIAEVLDKGGAYILFTTSSYVQQSIDDRIDEMRKGLKEHGRDDYETADIEIYDAGRISEWCNNYLSASYQVFHMLRCPPMGLLRWEQWEAQAKMRTPVEYVYDGERETFVRSIRDSFMNEPGSILRVEGLSGLGKTRLVLEAFRPDNVELKEDTHTTCSDILSSRVVYVPQNSYRDLMRHLQSWLDNNMEAILVMDDCSLEQHEKLAELIMVENKRIGMVTLDYEMSTNSAGLHLFKLKRMSTDHIEEILKQTHHRKLVDTDRRILADFSDGFPLVATLLADAQLTDDSGSRALKEDFIVNKLIEGRPSSGRVSGTELHSILDWLSVFDTVRFGDKKDDWKYIAKMISQDAEEKVYRVIQQQQERGIITKKGNYIRVTPRPLAIRLAARWWREMPPDRIINDIVPNLTPPLFQAMCDRLKELHDIPEAIQFAAELCGAEGLFRSEDILNTERGSRIFLAMVEVDPRAAMNCIKDIYWDASTEDLLQIKEGRRNLVWALERLAWWEDTFKEAAWLLLKYSVAENENCSNNATGQFNHLFQLGLPGTQAPYSLRFEVVDKALGSQDPEFRKRGIDALKRSFSTGPFFRMSGVERQGGRLSEPDWMPRTPEEHREIIKTSMTKVVKVAKETGSVGEHARVVIGEAIHEYYNSNMLDIYKDCIAEIIQSGTHDLSQISNKVEDLYYFQEHSISEEKKKVILEIIELLEDDDPVNQLMKNVVSPPHLTRKRNDGEYVNVTQEKAKELAIRLSSTPEVVLNNIHLLCKDQVGNGYFFGSWLSQNIHQKNTLYGLIEASVKCLGEFGKDGNPSFLSGLLKGLLPDESEELQQILQRIYEDRELVCHLVEIVRLIVPTPESLNLLLKGIEEGKIDVGAIHILSLGAVHRNIPEETLLDFTEGIMKFAPQGTLIVIELLLQYSEINKSKSPILVSQIERCLRTDALYLHRIDHMSAYRWRVAVETVDSEEIDKYVISIIPMLAGQEWEVWKLWEHDLEVLLGRFIQKYPELCLNTLGDVLFDDDISSMNIRYLLRGMGFSRKKEEIIEMFDADTLMKWCREKPDKAPEILADVLPVLEVDDEGNETDRVYPVLMRLIDTYGDNEDVLRNIGIYSFGSVGSRVPYYERRKKAVEDIRDTLKNRPVIREWSDKMIKGLEHTIGQERIKDEEREFGIY